MSTPATQPQQPAAPATQANPFAGMANPLHQMSGLVSPSLIKRSLPLIFLVGLVIAGALAWAMVSKPPQRALFTNLADADQAAVVQALDSAGIDNGFDGAGSITVAEGDYHKARMLLASQDLPHAAPGGYAILDQLPLGASRAVEGERLRQARETEMARTIAELDSVAEARVHLAMPEASVFVRDRSEPSASVIIKLQPGRSLGDAQVRSIVNLVASSVPGMNPDAVTIVDQQGALLSHGTDSENGGSAGNERIDFERRVEGDYREKLVQLLTPMLGAGNFTAEVQADVDLDESQATRESYEPEGALRAEQGNWTGVPGRNGQAPGGIPGALSNTPPTDATISAPQGGEGEAGADTGAAPGDDADKVVRQTDSFARTYDLGKEISVTRQVPGAIQRLSVAVLLREPDGQPRSEAEMNQITELVRAAVGYDQSRGDRVTVISRKFSELPEMESGAAWYEAGWVPMVARHATALVIALLVLLLGVRPMAKALLKKRDESTPVPAGQHPSLPIGGHFDPFAQAAEGGEAPPQGQGAPPVSIEALERGASYDERVGAVRGFTRDNPARAALAVRDMIRADGQ
ncbi:flagellar basal-body MS-ring/collar protein FliF [Stakelama tenebrarum]|uniref:Flagellar M-ring protein n=1 Tax=Stakelama tenebrarum TaxID=2711215 RepID=A0A6G6Y1D5_9SPHN|nr:flagellar basal-body MS-ring/collar protein FliF [Sphingosinithalassobacter tenebrarum]QIG78720.1 flagellar M-ring protein FliF [Sphingosinithalassobacter tenebrarum]